MFKSLSTHLVVIVTFAELAKGGSLLVKRTMELAVRQALEPSNIPSQCDSICAPIFSDTQRCGSLNFACLCTDSVRNDGVNCANCVASIFPSELGTLQAVSDEDVQGCTQRGFPIDPVKLTGISPGGSSVSAVGSNTATGSAAGSNTAAGSASPSSTTSASGGGGGSTKTGGGVHAIRISLPSLGVALGVGVACILL